MELKQRMEQQTKTILLSAIIFVCMISLAGIYSIGCESPYHQNEKRFAAVICTGGYYWEDIQAGIEQADQEFGTYTKYLRYERFQKEDQIEMLQKADYMNVDGIITIGQPNSEELDEMIQHFQDKGIPVVLIDTDDTNSGRDHYIGMDNYAAGKLIAEKIAEAKAGKAKILAVISKIDSDNQQARYDGFADQVEQYEGMEIVSFIEVGKEKTQIDEKVRQELMRNEEIDIVFCLESSNTTQVGYILESDEKYAGIAAVGFDINATTLEFIRNGTFLGTIKMDGLGMGYEAVRYLYEEKKTDALEYYSSIVFVDSSNVEEFYGTEENE